jgi:hypothetical protein
MRPLFLRFQARSHVSESSLGPLRNWPFGAHGCILDVNSLPSEHEHEQEQERGEFSPTLFRGGSSGEQYRPG